MATNAEATLFKNLQAVTSKIHATSNTDEILLDVSSDICSVFAADRLTIYTAADDGQIIVSKVKTGLNSFRELRLPIAPEFSVAGYVALHRKLVNIKDAYDARELAAFDPPVIFLKEVDERSGYRTRQMLVAPVLDGGAELLGVVQIINSKSGRPFPRPFEEAASELCRTLAIAFKQRARPQRAARSKFEYLVIDGVLTAAQFEEAVTRARREARDLAALLTGEYKVSEAALGAALSKFFGVPYEPFKRERAKPVELIKHMKRDYVESNGWLPLEETAEGVVILTPDPERVRGSRQVSLILGRHKAAYRVCTAREFAATVDLFLGGGGEAPIIGPPEDTEDEAEAQTVVDVNAANDNEVVKFVNKMVEDAHAMGASDIHVEPKPGRNKTRIRFRKDGSLIAYTEVGARYRDALVARIKIMCDLDIAVKGEPQDGKIKMKRWHNTLDVELRVATIPTAGGVEDVVMRILASGKPIPVDALGLSKRNLPAVKDAVSKPYGLFFVCGPTGSGKTTTLHSILGYINTPDTKIWTAEDPVEITQEGLRQVQINRKKDLTFERALRAFLRADPDVIMVGEMRDKETVTAGVEASLTGHLVFATLHTNSAPESITRLLEMGMDPFNFADALLGVLAQRLAKKLCSDCKKPRVASADEIKELLGEYGEELKATEAWKNDPAAALKALYAEWVKDYGDDKGRLTLYAPAGCDKCVGTGYRGRIGLHELLLGSDEVKKDIQDGARVAKMFATAIEQGMRTLKQDGIEKVLAGLTDIAQVRAVCVK